MTKQEFIKVFGENPEDVLGNDWQNEVEQYLEMKNEQELAQDCREEELANWAELHGAEQNKETGEWEV